MDFTTEICSILVCNSKIQSFLAFVMQKCLITIFSLLYSLLKYGETACYYSSNACPQVEKDFLNVHIVPHSHDDVGWLKTVEQYYYGANNSIQNAGVQYIYDSVLEELWKDSEKKFVSVEMEFFSHWWKEQSSHMKRKTHKVVERGQLEFVGGGWCMNDEAAASYVDIVDQMTLGLKFLNDTFGGCAAPKAVWQIDPFGHSREQASIFAQMGFEYLFLGRIDYQDKASRLSNREMEMTWVASDSLNTSIFTGVLYNTYSPPPGFCFDVLCGDETIVDDPDSPMFNIDRRSKQLVAYILEQSKHYRTNNIIITMGEDFHYQNAHTWYKNLDKLIKYINKVYLSSNIRLFYSTPSCYGEAVKNAFVEALPRKTDDFFPYASDPHAYWTGYFTSRPTFKGLVRHSSNLLRACKQIQAMTVKRRSNVLFQFQRSQAIAQHHDAVTGTAKQHVNNDYLLRLDQGIRSCTKIFSESFNHLLSLNGSTMRQEYCTMLNISQCWTTEQNAPFIVTLYNTVSLRSSHTVRIPVADGSYAVTDHEGRLVASQMVPIAEAVLRLPGRNSTAMNELVFIAEDLPPLGLRSYHVQTPEGKPGKRMLRSRSRTIDLPNEKDVTVSAYGLSLTFDRQTGHLIQVGNEMFKQQLLFYRGMSGNNSRFEFRASGAYIFRPNGTEAFPLQPVTKLTTIFGPIVTEIRQHFSANTMQIFRLHRNASYIELDWILGPIPIEDGIGKEYISRFTVPAIRNNGTFYTDSNGREVLERQLNHQTTYKLNITEPTAGNFYPVNSFAYVEDKLTKMRMTVLNDRAQGVSSLLPGSLEFMIHRRLLHDDAFGVGEALNETAYGVGLAARGTHWLMLGNTGTVARFLAQRMVHPPILMFAPTTFSAEEFRQSYRMELALINRDLPPNVNLLTLEPWDDEGRVLVRFEHFYGVGEDERFSHPVTISLKGLFPTLKIQTVEEVNLAANRHIRTLNADELVLNPMEIRTLIVST